MFGGFFKNVVPRLAGLGQKISEGISRVGAKLFNWASSVGTRVPWGTAKGIIGKEKVISDVGSFARGLPSVPWEIGEAFEKIPRWWGAVGEGIGGKITVPEATMGRAGEFLGHFT